MKTRTRGQRHSLRHRPAKPDLIHIIFNGGQSDERQGVVSLTQGTWLFYNWGRFSGHDVNAQAGVETLGITDDDFKLLLSDGDDTSRYTDLANWDHVVQLLTCPAFRLSQRLAGEEFAPVELLVVVRGEATQQRISTLVKVVGYGASALTPIGGNTDVLFHVRSEAEARALAAKLERRKFVESIAIHYTGE
jgi:hypothetical protein